MLRGSASVGVHPASVSAGSPSFVGSADGADALLARTCAGDRSYLVVYASMPKGSCFTCLLEASKVRAGLRRMQPSRLSSRGSST